MPVASIIQTVQTACEPLADSVAKNVGTRTQDFARVLAFDDGR
jgi:hypothetical protein